PRLHAHPETAPQLQTFTRTAGVLDGTGPIDLGVAVRAGQQGENSFRRSRDDSLDAYRVVFCALVHYFREAPLVSAPTSWITLVVSLVATPRVIICYTAPRRRAHRP